MAIMAITQVLLQKTSHAAHVASKDIMLEAKNAPIPDALPHLLLTGITAGVQKKKSKVEPGMERSEAKARKGNSKGKGRGKSNNQSNRSSKKPC